MNAAQPGAWRRLYRRAYRDLLWHHWPRWEAKLLARDYANLVYHGTIWPREEVKHATTPITDRHSRRVHPR